MRRLAGVALVLFGTWTASAGTVPDAPHPRFDRLHRFEEIEQLLERYARAYPDLARLESLGKSRGGRDIWLLAIRNPETGDESSKPAIYIDGNTHANEVQGAETALYVIDFVLSHYGELDPVTELVDRAVLYVVPVVNPDGRAWWFDKPSTADYPRTVIVPYDDDRDGLVDEDGPDDLDGDGVITMMRKKVAPGEGDYRLDPEDPRALVRAGPDELGDYLLLGREGYDNDGDGRIDEDPVGYVDPNRTWGYDWQPRYVQSGAGDYPLQIPETRSIALWALQHPNIAAVQSFHNAGRMILRGPGAESEPAYPPEDEKVYELIAEEGERLLPGYRKLVVWKDLYTVFGSTIDHFYRIHGAIAFTNELYAPPDDLDGDGKTTQQERLAFNDRLTFGRQFVPWHPVDHPQYGAIEVGGFRPDVGRVPEGWMLEEECHRNSAFVLYHASQLPLLRFGEPEAKRLDRGLWEIVVPVVNERAIPTVTAWARQNRLHRLDIATVEGAEVVASGVVRDRWLRRIDWQRHRPERLEVPGVPGRGARFLYFLLAPHGRTVEVRYDSLKGGQIRREVSLE